MINHWAVFGAKFARQLQSANSKIHRSRDQGNEIAAWNHRIDVEKQAKKKAKQDKILPYLK